MKKTILIILFIVPLCFSYYGLQYYHQKSFGKKLNAQIIHALDEKNQPRLLEIEQQLYQEIQSGNKSEAIMWNYSILVVKLNKYERFIEVFDKERLSDFYINHAISGAVCLVRYKLDRQGKECAEEIFNHLRQKPNYYDNTMYWQFAVLADKQNEIDKEDMYRSKLDINVLEMLLSLNKEKFIELLSSTEQVEGNRDNHLE